MSGWTPADIKESAKAQAIAFAQSIDPLMGQAANCIVSGCSVKEFAIEAIHGQVVEGARAGCSILATPAVGALCGEGAELLWEHGLKQTVGTVIDAVSSFVSCLFGCDQPSPPVLAIPPCSGTIDFGPVHTVQAGLLLNLQGVIEGVSILGGDLGLPLTPGEALYILGTKYRLPLDKTRDYPAGDGGTFGIQKDGTLGPMVVCAFDANAWEGRHRGAMVPMSPFPPEACYQDVPLGGGGHVNGGQLALSWPYDWMAPNVLTAAEAIFRAAPCFTNSNVPKTITLRTVLVPGNPASFVVRSDADAARLIHGLEVAAQAWAFTLKAAALALALDIAGEAAKRKTRGLNAALALTHDSLASHRDTLAPQGNSAEWAEVAKFVALVKLARGTIAGALIMRF